MKDELIFQEKELKKQVIVNAAEKLFFSKGFNCTSMDELAKEAGFTKKTIYAYFGSKDEIYYEIMLNSYKKINKLLKEKSDENYPSEIEKLKAVTNTLITFSEENSPNFKAIFDFENNNIEKIQVNETAVKCYEEGEYMTSIFIEILKNGIEKGEIRADIDISKTFLSLWSNFIGITNLMKYKKEYIEKYFGIEISEILRYSTDLIINYIRRDDKSE